MTDPRTSTPEMRLPAAILGIIFEHLQATSLKEATPTSLTHLRLLSRDLHSTVHPIIYRHIPLSHNLVRGTGCPNICCSMLGPAKIAQRVIKWTQHVSIVKTMDWSRALAFLLRLEKLRILTWRNNEIHAAGSQPHQTPQADAQYSSHTFAEALHEQRPRLAMYAVGRSNVLGLTPYPMIERGA